MTGQVDEAGREAHPFYVNVERILTQHDLGEMGVTDAVESLWALVEAESSTLVKERDAARSVLDASYADLSAANELTAEADREVAGLRTQLEAAEKRRDYFQQNWVNACDDGDRQTMERLSLYVELRDLKRDRDVLAGQVAAIRALCDEEEASEASDAPTVRATVFGFNMTPDEATAFEDRLAEAAHNHDQEAFCVFDRGAHINARLTTAAIRAALVASSPTTPEAKK